MPIGPRPKPPAETKIELMRKCQDALQTKYPHNPDTAVEYLLNFFTAVDLVGILSELKK